MVYRYYITQTTASGELLLPELPYPYIVYRYGKQGIKFDGIHAVLYGYAEYQGELMESTIQQFGLIAGESPKYYPIDEESARLAHEMMSLRDYVEGSRTAEYRRMVDQVSLIAYRKKQQMDIGYHEKIDRLTDCYAKQLAENLNNDSRIGAMCPSILISGGSNFPVRKKERQNAARERNMRQYQEIQKIIGQIKSVGRGGIISDEPNAVEKLKGKLESLEKLQAVMKEVNAYYRKHKTLDGCPHLSEGQIQKCRAVMESSGGLCDRPFPPYKITNNSAEIRRIRQRIGELEQRETAELPKGWDFDGGTVVLNQKENRVQILFAEKPDADIRAAMKAEGFRWSPSQEAWQRQLTQNGISAAKRITKRR